jgi:hypothetical protein
MHNLGNTEPGREHGLGWNVAVYGAYSGFEVREPISAPTFMLLALSSMKWQRDGELFQRLAGQS